ncbi:MAG: aldolase/citrate lyase family protein [Methylobacter sp.]|nr:aldolase/citrate lyase family protein [Methylobacter sp.]
MLQTNRLKHSLRNGKAVYGLLNSVPAPLLVEMLGYAGYDFVILDLEHVNTNPETLENMIRAAECAGLTALVRVPGMDAGAILRALDSGAQGIVVPHVQSRAEAKAVVSASRYHPLGQRGISGGRTTGFGRLDLPTYFEQANAELLIAVMIEDRAGVENIDAIVSVPGIDLVLEGAIDLSQSYGVPGQAQHPEVQAAILTVADACRKHDVSFCAVPRLPEQGEYWLRRGVHAFLLGDERGVAFRAFKAHLQSWKTPALP